MSHEYPGATTCWHVSPSVNRASIETHGLDWTRIDATWGIAHGPRAKRPPTPEMNAVFLCPDWSSVEFFLGFDAHPLLDVWEVDVRGLELEDGPDGWLISRQAIQRARIHLVRQDVRPRGWGVSG